MPCGRTCKTLTKPDIKAVTEGQSGAGKRHIRAESPNGVDEQGARSSEGLSGAINRSARASGTDYARRNHQTVLW